MWKMSKQKQLNRWANDNIKNILIKHKCDNSVYTVPSVIDGYITTYN